MTIEQIDVVDFISEDENGNINLSISDHLEWDEKMEHIYMLQEKINKYLSFIESGEISEHCDNIKDKKIIINVIYKYEPSDVAHEFLEKFKSVIEEAGFYLIWKQLNDV